MAESKTGKSIWNGVLAVIFDMDGLLVDTEPLHLDASNVVLEAFGHHLSDEANLRFIGCGEVMFWETLISEMRLPCSVSELMDRRAKAITALIEKDGITLMPGAREMVEACANRFPIAIASSTVRAQIVEILEATGLMPFFREIVSGGDPEVKNGKPAPDIFLRAAELLGVSPAHCLVFEDSGPGVIAAKDAGMKCVAVPNGHTKHLDFSRADLVAKSLMEL